MYASYIVFLNIIRKYKPDKYEIKAVLVGNKCHPYKRTSRSSYIHTAQHTPFSGLLLLIQTVAKLIRESNRSYTAVFLSPFCPCAFASLSEDFHRQKLKHLDTTYTKNHLIEIWYSF